MRRSGSWTPVFDYMLALLGIFLIIAITERPKTVPPHIDSLGLYAVSMTWPNGSNDDVDLWVQDPQGHKAWFAGLTSASMTLNGDDLGCASGTGFGPEKTGCENGERTVIKQTLPGEYTVNVNMYGKNQPGPTVVTCTLWELRGDDRILHTRKIVLSRQSQEATCFRFTMSVAGNITGYSNLSKSLLGGPSEIGSTHNSPRAIG